MTTARAKTAKTFIASPMESFDDESCFGVARFQLANACGATAEPSRYAHRAGPDPEAERQHSARECVVQAVVGDLGKTHLGQHCGAQFWLKDLRRLRCKIRSGGTRAVCSAMDMPSPVNEGMTAA